jgi:hypothetical protein
MSDPDAGRTGDRQIADEGGQSAARRLGIGWLS